MATGTFSLKSEAVEGGNSGVYSSIQNNHNHEPTLDHRKAVQEVSTMTIEMPSAMSVATTDLIHPAFSLGNDSVPCVWNDSFSTASGSSSDLDTVEPTVTAQQPRSIAVGGKFRRLHERSDSGQIRSKLLLKLGIEKAGMTSGIATEASRVVQQGHEDAFNEALKGDYGRPDQSLERSKHAIDTLATSPGSDGIIQKHTKRGNVCFDASVKVHPIPARSDYSKRMRSVMWVSPTEIQQNAARNSLEFAAEDWDVSKVVDDEDMIIYGGERVHPVHFIQMDIANHEQCHQIPME